MIKDVDGIPRVRRLEYSHGRKVIPKHDKRFVTWDGESTSDARGNALYCLFGNSDGWELSSRKLHSLDLLRFISAYGSVNPNVISVGYAFTYDVNHILRDIPKARIEELKRNGVVWYENFRLEYRPKKWFTVWDNTIKVKVQIYDIFTYFMCSAVKAWKKYLGDDSRVDEVSKGKDARETFTYEQLETVIRPYFRLELQLYDDLIEKLRSLLDTAGINPRGWYGPGSIANTLLQTRTQNLIVPTLPTEVIEAAQYAYFGGRFEQFKTGAYHGPVYSYDIRSAYPHAMRLLPTLAGGTWHHKLGEPGPLDDYGLYRVDFDYDRSGAPRNGRSHVPMPFPFRDTRSQIHYPAKVRGWYWGCEVRVARKWFNFTIRESYKFQPADDSRPFRFLEDMYRQRNVWKSQGNEAELALKLGINSVYGKLAQRVGNGERPKWHQLEYAGFATAYCRSMVYDAIMQNPMSVVAVETDGLFTTEPLELDLGNELGQWEYEQYDGVIYVQSGVYWLSKWRPHYGHQWHKARIRGFGTGEVGIIDAIRSVDTLSPIRGKTHRFAGFNGYLFREQWLSWMDAEHIAVWGGNGKRAHLSKLCGKCQGRNDLQLHDLVIMRPWGGDSYPHYLPWKPDTGMMNEYANDEERIKWVNDVSSVVL